MRKYHPLMKEGIRELFLLGIFLVSWGLLSLLLCWEARVVKPTLPMDQVIMSPYGAAFLAGALVYFLGALVFPLSWGYDEHGVRVIIRPDGSREVCYEDWIQRPDVRKQLGLGPSKKEGGSGPHIR
jgi:hypothetical protein